MTPPGNLEPLSRKRYLRSVLLAWAFGFLLAGAYAVVRYVPAAGLRSNDITTGKSADYPDLQPRIYDADPRNTTVLAAAAAAVLPRWTVIRTDTSGFTVTCEVKMPLGLFTDDVTVHAEPFGPQGRYSRVVIRSRSRLGKADLGENARHIRALQSAMDSKLPVVSL
ncbi:MAG: DUF1499 domain-containing protein [Cytophagales bacterium]|nr:DUF1499 domain-containing protein [Armatimonadota bacterium]